MSTNVRQWGIIVGLILIYVAVRRNRVFSASPRARQHNKLDSLTREDSRAALIKLNNKAKDNWSKLSHLILKDKRHEFIKSVRRILEMVKIEKSSIAKANKLKTSNLAAGKINSF